MTAVDEITIPDSPDALRDFMNDSAQMEKVLAKGKMGEVAKAYADQVTKKDKEYADQLRKGIEDGLAAFIAGAQENGATPVDLSPAKIAGRHFGFGASRSKGAAHNPKAKAAALDDVFEDAAGFFQAVSGRRVPNGADLSARLAKLEGIQNAFGSTVPSDGGFLIPEVLRSEIMKVALETAVMRSRATVIPMESLRVPIPAIDTTTNSGSIFGGIQAYWTEEAQALTASSANFGRVVLEAKKLTAYADIPNELIADAPAFMAVFDMMFPTAINWYEDIAFIKGSGVGEPQGWLNHASAVIIDAAVSSQVSWADVTNMFSRMLPTSLGNSVWLCAPDVFPQLAQMTFGTNGFPVLTSVGGGGSPIGLYLLGRPLVITEKVPALGTDGGLSLVDPSYYLIGDRQVMQAALSDDYKFQNDMTSFRVIERVDGRPWLQSAITPQNGSSNTLSPFVELSGTHT